MPKYLCHFPPCVINLNAIWKACIETPLATHSNSSAMSYGIVYVRTRRGWHILLFDSIWYILNGSLHSYERILSCILHRERTDIFSSFAHPLLALMWKMQNYMNMRIWRMCITRLSQRMAPNALSQPLPGELAVRIIRVSKWIECESLVFFHFGKKVEI